MTQDIVLHLGTAITDVFAFLGPADQHKLRRTSSAMCEWFDSASENGSLVFFLTFASATAADPRWKHAAGNPRGAGSRQNANLPLPQATVTVHVKNYCLSTFNTQARGEEAVADDALIDEAAIQLDYEFPFEHRLVVTGLFGMRSIGDSFCAGVKANEIEFKGEGSQLRSVGKGWMSDCPNLSSVTLSEFTALEEVGNEWLYNCFNLESFTSDIPMLKAVGDSWMSKCLRFKHVDLTGFTALEKVGDDWLYDCFSLESIAFASDMSKLRKVGSGWMTSCSSLRIVDLTGFTSLEEVGYYWMYGCSSLESITFASDMPELKKVGSSWMARCSRLNHVDLTGFTALEEVSNYWLCECSSLESVIFASDMSNLKKVGESWMASCSNIKYVDLTGFTALEQVGGNWMYGCSNLESIAFDMPNLKKVGDRWMASCSNLQHVDLTGCKALEKVGSDWLRDCLSLKHVMLPAHMSN